MAVDDEEQQTKVATKPVLQLLPEGTSMCSKYTLIVYNVVNFKPFSWLLPRLAGTLLFSVF